MNRLYLIIVVTIGVDLIYFPLILIQFVCLKKSRGRLTGYLQNVQILAWIFQKIRDCLNRKLESIFIDSSTIEYPSQDYGYATYLDNS